ncbi:MAG: 4Fe-4S dicluster domain-containing protein [Treponema sp.]|nr:4Fe-4S dicluster domain-containing protein [Treponema sp.]
MLKSELELLKAQIENISGVNPRKCMQCGKCSGTCPNYDAMEYHPNQFVAMINDGDFEALLSSKSVYACMSCMACLERCPRSVEPAKLIEAVRLVVERQKDAQHLKAEDIPSKLDADTPQQLLMSAFRKYRK